LIRLRWFGQSAFLVTGESARVFVDPFGDMSAAAGGTLDWRYPPIEDVTADLVLVTHDHRDHNAVDAIRGEPVVIATAGTHDSAVGSVVGIASEHDAVAGTQRGPNTIFRFELDGVSIAHFGDFGQPALRPEQREALRTVDVALFPAGGGPTTPVEQAASLLRELAPRVVVPMHFRTELIGFLDPVEPFLESLGAPVERFGVDADLGPLLERDSTVVALLDPPRG
jgi:L-ascorbate metabolism protein UlaG (beta-lactamase superfamily)